MLLIRSYAPKCNVITEFISLQNRAILHFQDNFSGAFKSIINCTPTSYYLGSNKRTLLVEIQHCGERSEFKNGQFWRLFDNLKLAQITRHINLNRTKISGKCQKLKKIKCDIFDDFQTLYSRQIRKNR